MFANLFSDTESVTQYNFSKWVDDKATTLGGKDVIDRVKQIFGNCAKLDYQQAKLDIPSLDLPDLKPFFEAMLVSNRNRSKENDDGLISFKTSEEWKDPIGVQKEYIVVERNGEVKLKLDKIFEVGHIIVNKAIKLALKITDSIYVFSQSDLLTPLFRIKTKHRITNNGESIRSLVFGLIKDSLGLKVLKNWEIINVINPLINKYQFNRKAYYPEIRSEDIHREKQIVIDYFTKIDLYKSLPFKAPHIEIRAILIPGMENELY